jgi:hypothetical protein
MNTRTITAAALAASILFQAPGFAQDTVPGGISAAPAADSDAVARESLRSFVTNNPPTGKGCFHVSYPDLVWEPVACKQTPLRAHPVHVNSQAEVPDVVGDTHDYAVVAQGLILDAEGDFTQSAVGEVSSVGVAAFGNQGILGSNEYSVQLNTNTDSHSTPSVCDRKACTVWQQFVYATDEDVVIPYLDVGAGLFIQYWLLDWSGSCPSGWHTSASGKKTDCYMNSNTTLLPDLPITHLGEVSMYAYAIPGGQDGVVLNYGQEAWTATGDDSVLDISSVWNEAEFNVVGDGGGSEAVFNSGSSITVKISLDDGSNAEPACVPGSGTTGETNNLNLGTCQAGVPVYPARFPYTMEFNESLPATPPPVITHCPGGITSNCKGTSLD